MNFQALKGRAKRGGVLIRPFRGCSEIRRKRMAHNYLSAKNGGFAF
jgi:hypothetical protein